MDILATAFDPTAIAGPTITAPPGAADADGAFAAMLGALTLAPGTPETPPGPEPPVPFSLPVPSEEVAISKPNASSPKLDLGGKGTQKITKATDAPTPELLAQMVALVAPPVPLSASGPIVPASAPTVAMPKASFATVAVADPAPNALPKEAFASSLPTPSSEEAAMPEAFSSLQETLDLPSVAPIVPAEAKVSDSVTAQAPALPTVSVAPVPETATPMAGKKPAGRSERPPVTESSRTKVPETPQAVSELDARTVAVPEGVDLVSAPKVERLSAPDLAPGESLTPAQSQNAPPVANAPVGKVESNAVTTSAASSAPVADSSAPKSLTVDAPKETEGKAETPKDSTPEAAPAKAAPPVPGHTADTEKTDGNAKDAIVKPSKRLLRERAPEAFKAAADQEKATDAAPAKIASSQVESTVAFTGTPTGEHEETGSDDTEREKPATARVESSEATSVPATGASAPHANGARAAAATKRDVNDAQATSSLDRVKLVKQVADKIEILAASRPRDGVVVHLEPKALGTITLIVKNVASTVEAQISASDENVRRELEKSQTELGAAMQQRGLNLSSVNVVETRASSSPTASPDTKGDPASSGRQPSSNSSSSSPQSHFGGRRQADSSPAASAPRSRVRQSGVDVWI